MEHGCRCPDTCARALHCAPPSRVCKGGAGDLPPRVHVPCLTHNPHTHSLLPCVCAGDALIATYDKPQPKQSKRKRADPLPQVRQTSRRSTTSQAAASSLPSALLPAAALLLSTAVCYQGVKHATEPSEGVRHIRAATPSSRRPGLPGFETGQAPSVTVRCWGLIASPCVHACIFHATSYMQRDIASSGVT